ALAGGRPRAYERSAQADLIREIVGNPFRPITINAAWLTPTVLSDALEEAGCSPGELLDHLRSAGPHVRGCWLRFVDCQHPP
ncbi:MAG: hypothetical protein LC749_12770, partial [Actinobacteria bacterium]|nr:hypothetical protein [Actinomycetota bacterium]